MTRVLLVICLRITRFCLSVHTVSGAVVLVEVGYETANFQLPTFGVGTGAVVGMVIQTLTVVTAVENGTSKRGVGCVEYLAMRALVSGGGVGSASG